MSKIEELMSGLMSGAQSGVSEYKYRNEDAQQGRKRVTIKQLKKEKLTKKKLLFFNEIAIPFNPFTMLEDETYHRKDKYRPKFSEADNIRILKAACEKNPELKEAYMKRAGVSEWDTTKVEEVDENDRAIFKEFETKRVFSFPVYTVKLQSFTGREGNKDYLAKVKRDPVDQHVILEPGESTPLPIVICDFLRDQVFERIAELDEDYKNGKVKLTKKQYEEARLDLWKFLYVTDDHPCNYVMCLELPLRDDYELDDKFSLKSINTENIRDYLRITKTSKKLDTSFASYTKGDWKKYDKNIGFYEMDMSVPDEDDNMQRGLNTNFEKPTNMLEAMDPEGYVHICEVIDEFLSDEKLDLEQVVFNSTYLSAYDPVTHDELLLESISSVLPLKSKYVTKKVMQANSDVILKLYGESAEEMLDLAADGQLPEGRLDVEQSKKEMKENIADIVGDDVTEVSLDEE